MQQGPAHQVSILSEVTEEDDVVDLTLRVIATPHVGPARIQSPNLPRSNHSQPRPLPHLWGPTKETP
jgi:hypothetical protein